MNKDQAVQDSLADPAVKAAEETLQAAVSSYGEMDVRVAQALEDYAHVLKSKKVRALDAANMAARAKIIRSSVEPEPETPGDTMPNRLVFLFKSFLEAVPKRSAHKPHRRPAQRRGRAPDAEPTVTPANEATEDPVPVPDTKDCRFCGETVKYVAVLCWRCKSDLSVKPGRTLLANSVAISAGFIFLVGFVIMPMLLMCILSPMAGLCTLVACILFAPLYFVPALVALIAGKRHQLPIFLLNVCLGWTILGWVGSLIWALVAKSEPRLPGSGTSLSIPASPLVLASRLLQSPRNRKILFGTVVGLIGMAVVDVVLAQFDLISPWHYALDLVSLLLGHLSR